jgi:N-dimethylarginine dimethylaminohydrolase
MPTTFDLATIDRPVFLMNVPLSLSAAIPNNIWMEEMTVEEREIDRPAALRQFFDLYAYLTDRAIVYLLPSEPGLQDQTYVSNLGIVPPHLADPTFVGARLRSRVRAAEASLGRRFFELMNFRVRSPAAFFEGEADLKHLRDDIYVGAHGIRTSIEALDWFEQEFGMRVIPFAMEDPYLYHLDCCLLPLTSDGVVLCTEVASASALRAIERHAEIIDVTLDDAYSGITNSVVLHDAVLCATNPEYLRKGHEYYEHEKAKIAALERICAARGFNPVLFDLSEFYKSGALLSCLIMHLNRANYDR